MDDPISIKREAHGLLQKMGSGAIDMSPAEAQKLLVDVRDRQHSLESVFSDLEMKKAHVTGQYEADFTPPWFGKWREKVHANRFSGYQGVSLLRHEVYSQDGTPNEMRAYVRSTEPPFPMMATVRSGGKVYRHIGTHYAMFKFSGQPDMVHVTVTALPFEMYTELETCLEEIVAKGTAVEEFVNTHNANRIADLEMEPGNRAFAQLQSQVLCPICWTTVRDTALNCGHTYCQTCAGRLVDCATCRQRVTAKSRIYL